MTHSWISSLLCFVLLTSSTLTQDTINENNSIPVPDFIWNATERKVGGNVTWKSGKVVLIDGELEITEGSSLTVRPGVRILFANKESGVLNNGLMRLLGGKSDDAFISMEPGYLRQNGKLGQWSGISFGPTAVSGTVPSLFTTSPKPPRYVGGSLFRRTRIHGIIGGVDGGLYCPHGRAPYMHHVTLDDVQGRAINIVELQERLVMRNVTVQRRPARPYERSDVVIRGARIRLVPALERAGSLWLYGLRVIGSGEDLLKFKRPFALSVGDLADGAVIKESHLDGGGSALHIFDFTKPVTIQRNTLVVADNYGFHLEVSQGLPVDGLDRNATNLITENDMHGGSMRLFGVYAVRVEHNTVHRGGFVWIRNTLPDSNIIVRSNQWRRQSEETSAGLFVFGTNFGSFVFSNNDIRDCQITSGDLFILLGRRAGTNPEKFDLRNNTVADCAASRALFRIDDLFWQIRRNDIENVTAPISVDISGITSSFSTFSTAPATYRNISRNYWGSTFSDDIASGHRQSVLDALSSTKTDVGIVDFGTVLTDTNKSSKGKNRPVSLPIGSLIRSDGTLGGIVLEDTHIIDIDDISGPSVVNLHLFVAGNATVRIKGGNRRRNRLQFRKDIGIRVLEDGKLILEGKRNGRYLELEPLNQDENWGQVSFHSTVNSSMSAVHMRSFGGIRHKGEGSLAVSHSWVEGSPPPSRYSREFAYCLDSGGFTQTALQISNSIFSDCYGGLIITGREEVLISNSSLSFYGKIGMQITKPTGQFEIIDSFVSCIDYLDYLTQFSSIIQLDYGPYRQDVARNFTVRNTVLSSNSSKAIYFEVCFSNFHLENNTINFRHYGILFDSLATHCDVKTISIRNNTFRDSVVEDGFIGRAGIEIPYQPNQSGERKGEGLVIADNSFYNVTHGHLIRANVHDARGTSVQITGNFFSDDSMALGGKYGETPPAFIYLSPWNCPGSTGNGTNPAVTCTVKGNTFMDRDVPTSNASYYYLAAEVGELSNVSDFAIDATRTYWGLTRKRDVADRILLLDDGEVIEHQDKIHYLPYRLVLEDDSKLFPFCANKNSCSDRGVCVNRSLCECWKGWEGGDCSVRSVG